MRTLAHTVVAAAGSSPVRAMFFLHGILGTRANWRSFARAFVDARPDWAAVLVDLRHHGDSLDLGGENDLEACVDDLLLLADAVELPIRGVLGHSFGGKVALSLLARGALSLDEVIVVDVDPAAHPSRSARGVDTVIATLDALPREYESREAFRLALERAGLGPTMQGWLGMNLVRTEAGVRFGPDLDAIKALLRSHLETDLMDVCLAPPRGARLRFLLGERSDAVSPESRAKLEEAAREGVLELEVVPGAGHWVHVDAPDAVRAFLTRADQRA
ncbi:MAG: alpha/beta hydrolase [Myxococcales bacterium]|nr:alpha/beta hydrolase [Myxococcales bacterium]